MALPPFGETLRGHAYVARAARGYDAVNTARLIQRYLNHVVDIVLSGCSCQFEHLSNSTRVIPSGVEPGPP